jgi:hypothetical protein
MFVPILKEGKERGGAGVPIGDFKLPLADDY